MTLFTKWCLYVGLYLLLFKHITSDIKSAKQIVINLKNGNIFA